MHAASSGEAECARLLLEAGADATLRASNWQWDGEKTALELAEAFFYTEMAALLQQDPRVCGAADRAMPAGTRVRVAGLGDGVYERFRRNTLGANDHFIRFPHDLEKVELKKLSLTDWSVLRPSGGR